MEEEAKSKKKNKGVEGLIDVANPNAAKTHEKVMKAKNMVDTGEAVQLTRRDARSV